MNNLKKIGLSALAGSLVATSAFAGEMSVGGSAKATWTDREDGSVTGNNFGMNKLLSFSGSGELDNGNSISVYFGNNGTSQSSASMTYSMGDMGSLTLDNGVGGHGIGSIDDKTPTANEEIWDNISHGTGHDGFRVGVGNAGALAYSTTMAGVGISVDYVKQGGGSLEDGATGLAGKSSSRSIALTASPADGMNVGVGMGDVGSVESTADSDQRTAFATYATGPVTVGVQIAKEMTNNDLGTGGHWTTEQWGISFNVNDNIAVGYGQRSVDISGNATDQEDAGFSASYTMGSMSLKGNFNKSDDMKGTAGSDKETTEIALSFAF
jgi:outer membrane protein OmpU